MPETLRDLVQLAVVVDPSYDQNCYVVRRRDTREALVFDPGLQHARVLEHLERAGLSCSRILLTHGHPDHVSGVPAVRAAHGCEAAMHPDDRWLLDHAGILPGVPDDIGEIVVETDLRDGEVLEWQGLEVAVLHTPGHTPGSICFVIGTDLVAGDTLFQRSVGRADLPGGDWEQLLFSIQSTLYALPPETVVYPGHGPRTTIREEMRFNPFAVHPRWR